MGFKLAGPLVTPATLKIPHYSAEYGVRKKAFSVTEQIFVNFRSFGGTETEINGLFGVENTATVETWYRPDIKSDCVISVEGNDYEILGQPEDIGLRHQYLRIKVREITGSP